MRPSFETSGCSTLPMSAASTWLSGMRRVTYSSVGAFAVPSVNVRRLVSFASFVGMMRTTAPLGTVVKPFTCSTAWKT